MGFVSSAMNDVAELILQIKNSVRILINTAICVVNLYTTDRTGSNFCYSPNPVSKIFFSASCPCGVLDTEASGTAMVTSFADVPVTRWLRSLC